MGCEFQLPTMGGGIGAAIACGFDGSFIHPSLDSSSVIPADVTGMMGRIPRGIQKSHFRIFRRFPDFGISPDFRNSDFK
jgi:hypothetical protein